MVKSRIVDRLWCCWHRWGFLVALINCRVFSSYWKLGCLLTSVKLLNSTLLFLFVPLSVLSLRFVFFPCLLLEAISWKITTPDTQTQVYMTYTAYAYFSTHVYNFHFSDVITKREHGPGSRKGNLAINTKYNVWVS